MLTSAGADVAEAVSGVWDAEAAAEVEEAAKRVSLLRTADAIEDSRPSSRNAVR